MGSTVHDQSMFGHQHACNPDAFISPVPISVGTLVETGVGHDALRDAPISMGTHPGVAYGQDCNHGQDCNRNALIAYPSGQISVDKFVAPASQIQHQSGAVHNYCDSEVSTVDDYPPSKMPITIEGISRDGKFVKEMFLVGHGETMDLSHMQYICSGKQVPFKDVIRLLWDPKQVSWRFRFFSDVSDEEGHADSKAFQQSGVFVFADVLPDGLVPPTNQGPQNPGREGRRPVFEEGLLTFSLEQA